MFLKDHRDWHYDFVEASPILSLVSVNYGQTNYIDGKPTFEVTTAIIPYINPAEYDQQVTVMIIVNEKFTYFSFHVNRPSHFCDEAISDDDLENWRPRSWARSKTRSHTWPRIQSVCFLSNSHQSEHQFLRYSNIQTSHSKHRCQGDRWNQSSRSHCCPNNQLMEINSISRVSHQSFLRDCQ